MKASKTTAKTRIQSKRKAIRFTPDPGTYAFVDSKAGRVFHPDMVALVLEEASKGCGLVIADQDRLREGDRCRVQIGNLPPILSEVRWRRELDANVFRIGLSFLE